MLTAIVSTIQNYIFTNGRFVQPADKAVPIELIDNCPEKYFPDFFKGGGGHGHVPLSL